MRFIPKEVLNYGTADLKDIAECFEIIFAIDLGQYRRTFLEIRGRLEILILDLVLLLGFRGVS